MNESEKRRKERVPLVLQASLSVDSESDTISPLNCLTNNICASGAFFHTNMPMPVGTEMDIDLVLPLDELKKLEGKSTKVKVSGMVVRTEEKGMAINFKGLKVLSVDK